MKNIIEINNLYKTYKSKKFEKNALDDVSINIPEGSFFGLLGPNGAGKSTLINILAGMVVKTSGSVVVAGHNLDTSPEKVRHCLGIVPQEVVIDPFFNVRKTLEYYAGYFGVAKKDRRTDEILHALNLADKAESSPRRLSGGMKRRLLIAKALVHNPKVLILDEPTAGVDVELRIQLWEYVKKLNKQGTTILLTTHYLEEAEELCDLISVIDKGKVLANDTKDNMLKNLGSKKIIFTFENSEQGISKVNDANLAIDGNIAKFQITKEGTQLSEITGKFNQAGLVIKDISTEETDLEDIFRKIVKMG